MVQIGNNTFTYNPAYINIFIPMGLGAAAGIGIGAYKKSIKRSIMYGAIGAIVGYAAGVAFSPLTSQIPLSIN